MKMTTSYGSNILIEAPSSYNPTIANNATVLTISDNECITSAILSPNDMLTLVAVLLNHIEDKFNV